MIADNLSILVSSFDAYSTCWMPFCHGLRKYWLEHPPLFFITNRLQPPYGKAIQVYPDQGWSKNLLYALDHIDTPYILYMQEDYWIQEAVQTEKILDNLRYLDNDMADYVRLFPAPLPDKPFHGDSRLGCIDVKSNYRTSLQAALWRKSTLQELIIPGESPWEFEGNGNQRSKKYVDRFLSVINKTDGITYTFTAVIEGEWSASAYDYALREGIAIDFDRLPKISTSKRFHKIIKNYLSRKKRCSVVKSLNLKSITTTSSQSF